MGGRNEVALLKQNSELAVIGTRRRARDVFDVSVKDASVGSSDGWADSVGVATAFSKMANLPAANVGSSETSLSSGIVR